MLCTGSRYPIAMQLLLVSSHQTIPTVYTESFALEWPAQTKQKHWFQFIYTSGIFRGSHITQRYIIRVRKYPSILIVHRNVAWWLKKKPLVSQTIRSLDAYYLRGLKNWLGRCNLRHIQAYPFTASTMTSFYV